MKKILILILGIVVGGGAVFFWQQKISTKTIENLQSEIVTLRKQVAEPVQSPQPSPPADINVAYIPVNSNWKLIKGDPNDTCSTPTFEGDVSLRGWYSLVKDGYAAGWNFNVHPADVAKLPLGNIASKYSWFNKQLRILDATPELEEKLKKANEQNPVSVTVKGYSAYCEGNPVVSLNAEAVKNLN